MIDNVDEDRSGMIEFNEFLDIINLGSTDSDGDFSVNKFFKDMANGKMGKKDLSFNMNV